MKITAAFTICMFALFSAGSAQITFQKTYQISYSSGDAFQVTHDSCYIITGSCDDTTTTGFFLLKLNALGDTLWSKIFDGGNEDHVYSIVECADGGYAICGSTNSFVPYYQKTFILKTDASGNQLWAKTYMMSTGAENIAYSILQTPDSGFAIAGSYALSTQYPGASLFITTDSLGNVTEAVKYASSHSEFNNLDLTQDSGFVFAGRNEQGELVVTKRYSSGTSWSKIYRTIAVNKSVSGVQSYIQHCSDGGYIIACMAEYFDTLYLQDPCLIKLDSSGSPVWAFSYDLNSTQENGVYVEETADHGFLLTGMTTSFGSFVDVFVIRVDGSGGVIFAKTFGGADGEGSIRPMIHATPDGGYLLASASGSFSQNFISEVYVVKMDSGGNSCYGVNPSVNVNPVLLQSVTVGPGDSLVSFSSSGQVFIEKNISQSSQQCFFNGIDQPDEHSSEFISIYPNPVHNQLYIQSEDLISSIVIFNLFGEEMHVSISDRRPLTVDCGLLPSGMYLVKMVTGNKNYFKKLIISAG